MCYSYIILAYVNWTKINGEKLRYTINFLGSYMYVYYNKIMQLNN